MAGRNNKAWGECSKSGQRMLLKNMVEDGYFPGMLVHPAWYEPRRIEGTRPYIFDRENLDHPAPQNNNENQTITWPLYDLINDSTIDTATAFLWVGDIIVQLGPEPTGQVLTLVFGNMLPEIMFFPTGMEITIVTGTSVPFINSVPSEDSMLCTLGFQQVNNSSSTQLSFGPVGMPLIFAMGSIDYHNMGMAMNLEEGSIIPQTTITPSGNTMTLNLGTVTIVLTNSFWSSLAWGHGTWSN